MVDASFPEFASILSLLKRNDPTLRALDLSVFSMGSVGLNQLLSVLVKNKTLLSLDLSHQGQIDLIGAHFLKPLLIQNKTLLSLNLSVSVTNELDIEMLAEGLSKNESLQTLGLIDMQGKIKPYGIQSLADALVQNKSLQRIDLRGNHLTPEDVLPLQNAAARALSIRRKALAVLLIRGAFDVRSAMSELPGDFLIARNIIEQAIPPIEILF
jgi:hypothetical protein